MDIEIQKQLDQINSIIGKTIGLYDIWAKQHGLNYNSLMVLYSINNIEYCKQKQICEQFILAKQTVSTILSEFKQKGFVVLETNPFNKREKTIKLTKSGLIFSDNILSKLHILEEKAMLKMGIELRMQFVNSNEEYFNTLKHEMDNEKELI